jgi:hypothetical protein
MSKFLPSSFATQVDTAASTIAHEDVGAVRFENAGKDAYVYMKSTAAIAAKDVVAFDPAADDTSVAIQGAANAYGAGIAVVAMDGSTTAVYAWVQVRGYVSGLGATMTAGQRVTAGASGAVASSATLFINGLGNSVAVSTTECILKGIL